MSEHHLSVSCSRPSWITLPFGYNTLWEAGRTSTLTPADRQCGPQQHRYIQAYSPSLPTCLLPRICASVVPSVLHYMLLLLFFACFFLAPSSATLSPAQSNQLCLCLLSRCQLYPIIFTSLAITQSAHLGKAEQTRGNGANCRCSAHYH